MLLFLFFAHEAIIITAGYCLHEVMSVVIETSLGNFTIDLYIENRGKACFNFLKLCKLKYYNYNLLFEIKKDYALRIGDPSNTGNGGHSIYYFDETACSENEKERKKYFSAQQVPIIKHTKFGQVSMINNGRDKHGSQFLITLADSNLDYLDKQGHTVFGEVVEGLDVLRAFNNQLVDKDERPYRDICISHTVILEDPFEDPDFLARRIRRARSPEIPDYIINSERVGICDDLDADKGKDEGQLRKEDEEKGAKSRAIVLEMIGDLPDAEVRPPENILFVCKLNPITEEEDLKRIFSRFGEIHSVNIVKDPKTNQSLQYGFIDFINKEDCEKAYLKMDNVLIDDRRIHVDFSQSVSRTKKRR